MVTTHVFIPDTKNRNISKVDGHLSQGKPDLRSHHTTSESNFNNSRNGHKKQQLQVSNSNNSSGDKEQHHHRLANHKRRPNTLRENLSWIDLGRLQHQREIQMP